MNIEQKKYIVTNNDIEKLAVAILEGDQQVQMGRGTYLKALVATTQSDLGAMPRQRNAKADKLTDVEVTEHLQMFQAVADRFFKIVVHVAETMVPAPDAALVRQRTGFARSAASTVRGYIRAGGDIRALAASRVTKASLATPATKRKPNAEGLKRRVDALVGGLESTARDLLSTDAEMAKEVLSAALARLAVVVGVTDRTTRDAEKAIAEHIALKNSTSMFVPVNLADIREARRAAA